MKKDAFGAIDLLIGLVVISLLSVLMINVMKSKSPVSLSDPSFKQESVEQQANKMIEQIEGSKEKANQYSNQNYAGNQ